MNANTDNDRATEAHASVASTGWFGWMALILCLAIYYNARIEAHHDGFGWHLVKEHQDWLPTFGERASND